MSYASQDPWIFSGTIKENIIFGQNYDEVWYNRVIECCSLVKVLSYVLKLIKPPYKSVCSLTAYLCVNHRILMKCHLAMLL